MIDRTTPFRDIGPVSLATWREVAAAAGSPLSEADLAACHAAAGPHSALILAHALKETRVGATAPAPGNMLGLMADGAFLRFGSWEEGVRALRARWDDPTYKGGIYQPPSRSLGDYIVIYVGGPGCLSSGGATCANGETWWGGETGSVGLYLRQTIDRINNWQQAAAPPDKEDAPVAFGNVARPDWKERLIPDTQNRAWDNLGPRTVRGLVYHRMVGTLWGTDSWFRMRPGGGDAGLTDFGMDHQTGELLRWNDPTGKAHPGVSPNRAGWASGPWENPPGDGRAFVAKFGANAINRDLVSIEIAGYYDSPISPVAEQRLVQLSAWLADQARVPWTDYPTNPATGLTFVYGHNEFQAHKPCPGAVVESRMFDLIAATKEVLRAAQTRGEPQPPTPGPTGPTGPAPVAWPGKPRWLDADAIPYLFPEATPGGVRTSAWLAYAAETGRAPARKAFLFRGEDRELILFDDGAMIDKAGRWIGKR